MADSDIEYDVHPKVLAKLYREAGWWFHRSGKADHSEVKGLDIHSVFETLRSDVLSGPEIEYSETARLRVSVDHQTGAPVKTLEYFVRVGTEYINVENDEPSAWVQDDLFATHRIDNGGYL
ncbi:hypothetical protein AB0941_42845 [Streptomyces sp. NPDC013433]|uniref:hypothetical protein n=1 Tax=Streptomyces sp. NPDC013433 TaxID=3155604 RepID=UPI0034513E03